MKNIINKLGLILISAIVLIACDNHPSLQKYYVDSKENNEFISLDLPASILELKDTDASDELKKTLKSIKKVNFLALQVTDSNQELYTTEKAKVNAILKNPKFKQLARMNMGSGNVSVNYLGEETAIDEVVIFGADKSKGLAVVRVLGENMNPTEILKLAQEIRMDGETGELKQLESLLKGFTK